MPGGSWEFPLKMKRLMQQQRIGGKAAKREIR
jgi:hypothetical protein